MVRLTPAFKTLSFFTLFATTLSADVFYTFNIQNANIAPDGFTRAAVTVNGVFPGTLIQATKNDVLHITVNNQLTNPNMRRSTSIHWHGLFQGRTASEDVTAMVTQCPIAPGNSYTYDIPLNGQSGTHWYHSHLSSQYVDGLRGTIVVYDPTDPHAALYDEDNANTVIQLGDWYHLAAPGIQATYMAGNHEPVPDSGTINGIGRYVGGPSVTRARVNVVQGKKYRLRIVNISAYGSFLFSVESHKLTIIEVDGVNHVAKTVDGFNIYAGQRYSAVLHANQPVRNYWIRAPMDLQHHSDNDNRTLDEEDVYAVLHYDGAPNAQPSTRADRDPDDVLQEYQLAPLENPGPPGGSGPADRVIDLEFSRSTSGGTKWMFNGIQYHSPNIPTLLKIMSGATLPSDFATTEHTLVLNHNEVVELHLHGSANGMHVCRPLIDRTLNLHGHAFDVIQGNSGPANYVNPPRRDVVAIKGGTGIIRFRADNPGPWFLHCHWHLEAGLAVVFAEAPAEQRSGPTAQIIKQEWLDLCPIYDALPAALQ
ncbi:laccase 17 [Coprinopsis marcescibilis]|uniref:Laccase 17 n=1 Tax=Coprinopsis marcescibilis TaxID=230819 RepID=A0A5C3KXW8_COPMA|nr:laccase 17 [Coprinopsis marcescibilis]